jgi:hypothetical protein
VNDSRAQFVGDSRANFIGDSKAQLQKDSAAQNLGDSGAQYVGDSRASYELSSGSTAIVNTLAMLLASPVTKMIPGVVPVLWFDATDPNGNGTSLGEGAFVTAWNDKSGNGNNTLNMVASSPPTYTRVGLTGYPAVQFNGSQSFYGSLGPAPINGPYTIFIVGSVNDWTGSAGGMGRIPILANKLSPASPT